MGRLPDQHLNLYELTLLASDELSEGSQLRVSDSERRELEDHLLSCRECRESLEQQQIFFRMSKRLSMRETSGPGPGCPSEQQWMEFVAGLYSPVETQEQLEHAIKCAHCSARLKQVAEQFADETTGEEMNVLDGLRSADPNWQKSLAKRMQATSSRENPSRSEQTGRDGVLLLRFGIALASATVLLSAIGWFTYFRPTHAVNRLLSLAYSEQRTTDLRMPGSRYASVEAFRGSETPGLRRPTALLEAEVMIAKELASKPDDPFWLDTQGRADLMDDNYSSALASLERARRYAPENQTISIDLASAYFLRGEELKRSEDYGRAVDLLGQVLSKDPRNEVARFNHAIASERLLLYHEAVEDWHRYLELDPDSPWSEEGRRRLADLEEKIDLQKKRSERPLLGPAEFVALLQNHRENLIRELDFRIEPYFEVALTKWVPEAFSKTQGNNVDTARHALDQLAKLLASNHGDYWFTDFLEELKNKPQSRSGLPDLIDSLETNQTADLDHAREAAIGAGLLFRKSGNHAGELLAEFESSYADQLAHQVANCLSEARARNDSRVAKRYPWLLTQFSLESAICMNLNDETARRLTSEAVTLATLHHFPALDLRATTFLAALYQYMGDPSSAWRYSTTGLARYWEGDFSSMRGYSLYSGLDQVAEDTAEWFLDAEVLREASHFISDDPDLELRAMAKHRLANALAMTGDFAGAERSLREAHRLFLHSADGARKNTLECEAEIGLAKLELLRSDPDKAIRRLEPLRAQVSVLSDKDLVFEFFRNLGLAYFALGASIEANQDLGHALALAEESLRKNRDERERLIWCRKTDQVYRAMVQLKSQVSPREAFAQWQWFKGASLRGSLNLTYNPVRETALLPSSSGPTLSFALPVNTVVVSYAVFPSGTFAWTYSSEGVRQFSLAISAREVELLAHRFVDHCSRPDSKAATVADESHVLYETLFEPLESSLGSFKHLIVEPDKALWLIPFEALLDRNEVYLGDRYAISVSPGLDYLSVSPAWQGITRESRILIAADPETTGKKPLEDAQEEAKGIARQFRYSHLLLQGNAGYGQIAEQMGDAEIFHFSGHAAASPDGVGLLLGDSSVMDVARIRASQFSRLKLAVLSACNSANGAAGVFDDHDSLARLLVGAGVPEVVASRWMVNSRATAAIMQEFYAQLLSGKDVSAALHDATRRLRTTREFAHPFYWASFSAFGKS